MQIEQELLKYVSRGVYGKRLPLFVYVERRTVMKYSKLILSGIGVLPGMLLSDRVYKSIRLKRILKYAKKSDFYKKLYNGTDTDKITMDNLRELPPITKQQLVDEYDEWVCDHDVKLAEVNKFISSPSNLDKLLHNKYKVDSTSGTTGEKFAVPAIERDMNHMMVMGAVYTWPKLSYVIDILTSGRPVVYLIPTDGFYASVFVAKTYLGFSKNKKSAILDFRTPLDEIVEQINRINPILIGGYVSTMLMLADEAEAGRLKIDTRYVVTIGSAYSDEARTKIANAFHCKTFTNYSSTEGGEMGCECVKGHYHISREVIVETADDNLQPVGYNKESDCILVTNLWNTAAPIIRYRINDRCILHDEPCGCGRKSQWIEVSGRESTNVPFTKKDGTKIQLSDLIFELVLHEMQGSYLGRQIIARDNNRVEIRIKASDEAERHRDYGTIKAKLEEIAASNNIELDITLSDEEPIMGNTGKLRCIIVDNSNANY